MDERTLQLYLRTHYPKENAGCEWKKFKNLKHAVSGDKGGDVVSYLSAIANMEGGHLVIGVEDASLRIVGIQDFHDYTEDNIRHRLLGKCVNLDLLSEMRASDGTITCDGRRGPNAVWRLTAPTVAGREN